MLLIVQMLLQALLFSDKNLKNSATDPLKHLRGKQVLYNGFTQIIGVYT